MSATRRTVPSDRGCNSGKCEGIRLLQDQGGLSWGAGMHRHRLQRVRRPLARRHLLREGRCGNKKPCKFEDDLRAERGPASKDCASRPGEHSRAPPPKACSLEPVFFDFKLVALTASTSRPRADADCLKKVGRSATLFGHTDPRGPPRIKHRALQRRAASVRYTWAASGRRHQAHRSPRRLCSRQGDRLTDPGRRTACRFDWR